MPVSPAIRTVGNVSYIQADDINYVRINIRREDGKKWGDDRPEIHIDLAMEKGDLVAWVYPKTPSAEGLMRKDLDELRSL